MSVSLADLLRKAELRMFAEAQANLPAVDRCADSAGSMCSAKDEGLTCTKVKNHEGDHCAHGILGYILHRWKVE